MRHYGSLATLALVAVLFGSGPVLADAPGASGPRHGAGQRFQQELGLTDSQAQALREIRERQRGATRQVWGALVRAQAELRQLALGGAADAAVQAKIAEIEQLHRQSLELRVAALREMAPILSEEQRQKLGQMSLRPWHRRHHGPTPQG
jgi:Spy/CpxP family protein refolding chaperone